MRLYKYLHPDRVDILASQKIRFTQPALFNDPFEMNPYIKEIASDEEIEAQFEVEHESQIRSIYNAKPRHFRRANSFEKFKAAFSKEEMLPRLKIAAKTTAVNYAREALYDAISKAIGILCLTTKPDNLLMWAHYANSHTGFVLELNSEHSFFHQKFYRDPEKKEIDNQLTRDYGYLTPVSYSANRPVITVSEVQDFSQFLIKGQDWSYEEEWRMLMPTCQAENTGKDPLGKAIFLFQLPASAISRIILGYRSSSELLERITDLKNRTPSFSHIVIEKMHLHEEEFRLLNHAVA